MPFSFWQAKYRAYVIIRCSRASVRLRMETELIFIGRSWKLIARMPELWIKFKNEKGEDQRVLVDKDKFVIGRHSSSDLSIPNSKLSREHLRIERFGDIFIASDPGSSNGTELNGARLSEPLAIKNGDAANLGGGLDIEFEIASDDPNAAPASSSGSDEDVNENASDATSGSGVAAIGGSLGAAPGGFPMSFLLLAPLFGLVFLIAAVGLIFVFSGGSSTNGPNKNGYIYSSPDPEDTVRGENTASSSPTTTTSSGTTVTSNGSTPQPSPRS